MSSPKKYDPPEAVVGPAFSLLLNRLARSRVHVSGGVMISEEEQKIFDYGVTERKRVLEHTLALVFGQWAVYRQVISRIQSRGIRVAYGLSAFVSTGYFMGARAKRVSHEMFATIATTATNSPLGNEARVVLAELEGPDGPYFRKICRAKGFAEDIASVIADLDAQDGVDPAWDHLHPQLRLRPRLPVPVAGVEDGRTGRRESRESDSRQISMVPGRLRRSRSGQSRAGQSQIDVGKGRKEGRESDSGKWDEGEDVDDDIWGNPFDFGKASIVGGDTFEDNVEQLSDMTPSQRRAAERRERRSHGRRKPEDVE